MEKNKWHYLKAIGCEVLQVPGGFILFVIRTKDDRTATFVPCDERQFEVWAKPLLNKSK